MVVVSVEVVLTRDTAQVEAMVVGNLQVVSPDKANQMKTMKSYQKATSLL